MSERKGMAFLKILSCSLIFIVAAAPFIEAQSQHYDIYFVLNSNASVFHGEYNVSIYIPHETQEINFYTENLSIIKITVINNTQIFEESEEKIFARRPKEIICDTETYITTISFPHNLLSGNYILNVKFSGLLTEDGGFTIYIDEENERVWFAATHYQTIATRRLFPLLKDTLYASYNISIKHHKHYTAFSNMPVQEINMDENNMQWTRFKSTPVMPVYFIAVSIAHVALTSETSQAIKLWCRTDIIPHMEFAYTVAKDVAHYLDKAFPRMTKGSPESNHIVIPHLLNEEDIKFGFVLYGEKNIIFNEKIDFDIRRVEIAQVIGYKVVHEWFYNAIDPYKWEVSLSKGFAKFFGIFAADKIFPHLRIQDFFVVQMQHDVLHWSTTNTWPFPLIISSHQYYVDTTFEVPSYIKASIMFRSLQIIFTEGIFLYGIGSYFKSEALGSYIFFDVMQSISDEYSMKYNVTARIIGWTQVKHYPVINVERNYDNSSLNISVNNFNLDIWIFVNITTQTHFNSTKLLSEVWLAPYTWQHILNIDFIDKNDWVLANLKQTECYRVNYDAENWNRLSKYLNTNAFRKIHVLDRAKIIDDTFHFMMTGELNSSIFLNISRYLLRDYDYIAWYPMFKSLEYMSGFFKFPESTFMKTEIMHLLNEIVLQIFNRNKNMDSRLFVECLKQEARKWLCTFDQDECLHIANHELKWHLYSYKNYLPNNIWTGWKEWTFCNGLKTADNNTWMQVFDRYLKEPDHSFLKFLTCSKNSLIILQYIHLIATFNVTTAVDHINVFYNIVARHAKNPELFDFILDSLQIIKPKGISYITALTIIINHVYFKQQINKIKEYMEIKFTGNPEIAINYEYYENGKTVIKSLPFEKNMESIKMYVNSKLELRWKQIKIELYEYRYLIKNVDDVYKEYEID